ncbi:unnamed protein product [Laminaria digitata]
MVSMIRSVARVVAFAGLLAACSAAVSAAATNNNNNLVGGEFNNLDNLDADLVDLLHAAEVEDAMRRKMQEDDGATPSPSSTTGTFESIAPTGTADRGIEITESPTPAPVAGPDPGIGSEAPTVAPTPAATSAASATVPVVLSMAAAVAVAAVVTVAM